MPLRQIFKNFFSSNHVVKTSGASNREVFQLPSDGRDYSEFGKSEVAVRIWIPAKLDETVELMAQHFRDSKSQLIRQVFFVYAYGRAAFEQMRARQCGFFQPYNGPRYSIKDVSQLRQTHRSGPNTTPQLGKNSKTLKLWMPQKLVTDLQALADKARTPLSQYLREILVAELLGHCLIPDRASLINKPDDVGDEGVETAKDN